MGGVLVVGIGYGSGLIEASREAIGLALQIGKSLNMPVMGTLAGSPDSTAINAFSALGLSEVIMVADTADRSPLADQQVAALELIAKFSNPTLIIAPHTLDTQEWMPYLAGRLGASIVTDCKGITAASEGVTVTKMICGGAVGAEYRLNRPISIITLAAGASPPAMPASPQCSVRLLPPPPGGEQLKLIEETQVSTGNGPDLRQAPIVVSGGLGVGGREQWSMIVDVASALEAAVGATRAVVESGWVPASQQVGYSGAKISPDLYIAIGISGAVHHLAGISQAKTVVAINIDPNAEIFKVAHFGVVGDAKAIVPAFAARLRELRAGAA